MSASDIIEKLKEAAISGHDFRRSLQGRPNMPTEESTAYASKLLRSSQSVGKPPKFKGPSIQQIAPKMSTNKGSIPKIGADMSKLEEDPLIMYLKKEAEALQDNESDMPQGEDTPEVASEDPMPTGDMSGRALQEHNDYLSRLFDNTGYRKKFTQKEK